MKGSMHKLFKASAGTYHVPHTYKRSRPIKTDERPLRKAALAPDIGESKWTVVCTASRQELNAVEWIREAGYEAYCPVITRWTTIGRLRTRRHVALFPRYIFVGLVDGALHAVGTCHHVTALTLNNGSMPVVPPGIVKGLSDRQASGEWDQTKEEKPDGRQRASSIYSGGESVIITTDIMDSVPATIIHACDDDRVQVLMDLLGRATVRLDQIRAAG
jgi:hypothetical protein